MPIPEEMKALEQWVVWDWQERNGSVTKVPRTPEGNPASSTDPATWSTFEAVQAVEADHAGLGFVFSPKNTICGIDLDACYDGGRSYLAPWAQKIIALCKNSYMEISPSGTGIKIFGLYHGKIQGHRMNMPGEPMDGKKPGWERYTEGRFFTVTENEGGQRRKTLCDLTAAMELLDGFVAAKGEQAPPQDYQANDRGSEAKPERLEGLLRLDPELMARWSGATDGLKDESPSGLDMSIACHLAFFEMAGADIEQALRWRRRSLDLPMKHDGYFQTTVSKALGWAKEQRDKAEPLGSTKGTPPEDAEDGSQEEISWADVYEMDLDVSWAVQGLLPHVGISCIAAKPKVGKSTLGRDLAYAVASGDFFLGRGVEAGDVLYVDADGSLATTQRHLKEIGLHDAMHHVKIIHPKFGDVTEQIQRALKPNRFRLVIIDTLQTVLKLKDLNDYSETGRMFAYLRQQAEKHSTHFVLIHHDRKAHGDGGDSTLGSTAIFGGVDTLLKVERDNDGRRSCSSVQRDGEDMEPTEFELEAGRVIMGHKVWEGKSLRQESDRARYKAESAQVILNLVAANPGVPKADLIDSVKGNQQRVRSLIKEMIEEGQIREERDGKQLRIFLTKPH